MRIGTFNLEYGMSRTELQAAGRRIARRRVGIAVFQELREEPDRQAVQEGLGTGYGWQVGGQCPQAFRTAVWEVVDRSVVARATKGLDGVTPDLPITRVVYQHRTRPRIRFAVYATHLVPLSLHGRPRADHQAERRAMWHEHWERLADMVTADVDAGLTVFVLGDFNNIFAGRSQGKRLHARARWLHRTPLDWVLVVEGSVRVRRLRRFSFATGSDHKGIGASVLLTAKQT